MQFSKLSPEARKDMLADAANPAYRELAASPQLSARTPDENFALLCAWLKVLSNLVALKARRDIPRTEINLL
jgi:hypothetical protein